MKMSKKATVYNKLHFSRQQIIYTCTLLKFGDFVCVNYCKTSVLGLDIDGLTMKMLQSAV